MNKITPTFNSKISQRIDKLRNSLSPKENNSSNINDVKAIMSSVGSAMLSGTDVDRSVINFIEDHMGYFKRYIPEVYYVMLLTISIRDDDISKRITDQSIQDSAIMAFESMSKRYSNILSMSRQDFIIEKYQSTINSLVTSVLSFTLDINDAFPITTISQLERNLLISKARVFTINAIKNMVNNNIPYLWSIVKAMPVNASNAPIFEGYESTKPVEDNREIYQKSFLYRNKSCETYTTLNPECVEVVYNRGESYKYIIDSIGKFITNEYAAVDIHSMFMIQKHIDSKSTDSPTTHQTISTAYHVGLAIVYYREIWGVDVSEMLSDEYIKFIFKNDCESKNNANDNFITLHNCIAYLDKKFGYNEEVLRSMNKYRNFLKLLRVI